MVVLEEKLNTDAIAAEYESILKKRHQADCRVALRPENGKRNRFPNYLPYEDTRVRLLATPTNPHGYINASHVQVGSCMYISTLCYCYSDTGTCSNGSIDAVCAFLWITA